MLKKISVVILILCILSINVEGSTINTNGGSNTVPVELTQSVSTFSVTVPTVLPVNVDGSGLVTVSTNNKIINNSFGPVEVKSVELETQKKWNILDFNSNFEGLKVGSKQFGFQINDVNVELDGSCSVSFPIIGGQDEISFTYNAKIAPQNTIITKESIANVVFTMGWSSVNNSVSNLENKYQFSYYSSAATAVSDVNNGTIGANADVDKEDAVAGIYTDENGVPSVAILKDSPSDRLNFTTTATLNLCGHKLSFTGTKVAIGVSGASTKLTIEGKENGSEIEITNTNTDNTKAIQIASGECIVNGGRYTANSNGAGTGSSVNSAILVAGTGSLSINNATVTMNDSASGYSAAIIVNAGTDANITNCNINSSTVSGFSYGLDLLGTSTIEDTKINSVGENAKVFGIYNDGVATINNITVKAYSNYTSGTDGNIYNSYSIGVENNRTMEINDSFVSGTHSGLENMGILEVNGGVYDGYGHGGFYFSGTDSSHIVRIKGVTIRQSEMPVGYIATETCNKVGFYIGGTEEASNLSVYMDDCDIYANKHQIVLRGTSGEKNNSLYISNSNLYGLNGGNNSVRIDNDSHTLYLGKGNNFTSSETTLPSAVVETDEVYNS